MAKQIPNELTKVHFVATISDGDLNPAVVEVTGGVDLTEFLTSLEASSSGQIVPTPSFDSLFETNIPGTASATFNAEFYRDDTTDTAWDTLPRGTSGYFVIARFGYSGADNTPAATDTTEVWPVRVVTRAAMALANNDVQRFRVECAVPVEPNETAVIS